MSQNTVVIVDGTGLEVLGYMNDAFNTLVTNNSGSSAPSTTYAHMLWADTTNSLLKMRDAANTGWITIGTLGTANLGLLPSTAIGSTVQAYDADLATIAASNAGSQIASYGTNGIGFKNRVINGNLNIDQINGLGGVTVAKGGTGWVVDRFGFTNIRTNGTTMACTVNSNSLSGYGKFNSVRLTNTSAGTTAASDDIQIYHPIEGNNIADLAFGTGVASTITISFLFKASATGTYSVTVQNATRSYVTTITVNTANTWEYKTITVTGDTSGTWNSDNTLGMYLIFNCGCGTTFQTATLNTWQTGNYRSTSSSVKISATTGAFIEIAQVQLEKGSTATPFEVRPYGTELTLCLRYYQKYTALRMGGYSQNPPYTPIAQSFPYTVWMRAAPTATVSGGSFSNCIGAIPTNPSQNSLGLRLDPLTSGNIIHDDFTMTLSSEL